MSYCCKCGSPLKAEDVFCGKCGTMVKKEKNICRNCQTELKADALFCPQCGCRADTMTVPDTEEQELCEDISVVQPKQSVFIDKQEPDNIVSQPFIKKTRLGVYAFIYFILEVCFTFIGAFLWSESHHYVNFWESFADMGLMTLLGYFLAMMFVGLSILMHNSIFRVKDIKFKEKCAKKAKEFLNLSWFFAFATPVIFIICIIVSKSGL